MRALMDSVDVEHGEEGTVVVLERTLRPTERGMRQLARIVAETHGDDVVVARIEGEVDMSNAPAIGNRLRELLTNRSVALIVDLGPTTLPRQLRHRAVVRAVSTSCDGASSSCTSWSPTGSQLARVLRITGLDRAVPMHATLDGALERAG